MSRTILLQPMAALAADNITHLVSGSGRYLGFLTTRPERDYRIWELQVYEPQKGMAGAFEPQDLDKIAYRIVTLRRRTEMFNAGRRGRFSVFAYEVAMGEERLLFDLPEGLFVSAGELLGVRLG